MPDSSHLYLSRCSRYLQTRRWLIQLALCLVLAMLVSGCGLASPRAVIVPVGEPVMLLADTPTNSKVLVADSEGQWIEADVDYIPAGWACLAPEPGDLE